MSIDGDGQNYVKKEKEQLIGGRRRDGNRIINGERVCQ